MKPLFTLLILTMFGLSVDAQINAYARVTSISSTVLDVSSANETYGTFTAGSQVIIMQMQDDVIGSNTGDNSNFGNLSTISSAGNYEVATISSVVRSSGVVVQIVINSPLAKTFNTGANSSVQVISYPLLGSNGYATTADINAVAWNGSVGGVIAFRVNGTLTLNHNINADYAGFRGGTVNSGTAGSCDATVYRTSVNDLYANKGEGIYKATSTSYVSGRGKILNGGGGGNSHNGGGGGGSNLSGGGDGGKGYGCTASSGGIGGIALTSFVSGERVFMGGGGGAGEANNSYNTTGGNGGGVIMIRATQITTTGSGAALKITANGQTPANVGNDGAGAGGAGGGLLLNVQTWNISASKPLVISANGGSGGNVTDAAAHGGGGGGGQGEVVFSGPIPVTNITTTTLNGLGGRNYAGGTFAANGTASDNDGVMVGSFAILANTSISFKAYKKDDKIICAWNEANDFDLIAYEVQRSDDGSNFKTIATVKAADLESRPYTFVDNKKIQSTTYYRLLTISNDGSHFISNVAMVNTNIPPGMQFALQPNLVHDQARLLIYSERISFAAIRIMNMYGGVVETRRVNINKGENNILLNNLGRFTAGSYQVAVTSEGITVPLRMTIQK